jgi:hypothetical protein
MTPDTVQIGPIIISKSVFDALMVLVSVIIGGLVTYFTTQAIEHKKWRERKQDKMQEYRREALALALEWLPPIEIAIYKASVLSSGFLRNELSEDKMRKDWPHLLHDLAMKDLPMRFNVLLPSATQKRIDDIISLIEDLQSFALRTKPVKKMEKEEWMQSLRSIAERTSRLNANSEALNQELKSEYEKTFI